MVKNTTGGSKHKGMARKDMQSAQSSRDYVPTDDAERYALVTKLLGNGMCHVQIFMHDNSILKDIVCHIRGKFRSKNKRHNTISLGSKLVIGIRTWESILKNCDLLAIIHEFPKSILNLCNNHNLHNDDLLFDDNFNNNHHNHNHNHNHNFNPTHESFHDI